MGVRARGARGLSGVGFSIGEIISYHAAEGFFVGYIEVFIKQLLSLKSRI
jgi:hypothetical protein